MQKDRLAPVYPAHDVVNRSGIFNAHQARHEAILPQLDPPRNPINGQKYGLTALTPLTCKEENTLEIIPAYGIIPL
jgi:hypothetical protein